MQLNGEGQFLNNAYKIYMPLSESMQSKGYRFDFDGTTGIENVNTDGVDTDAVYDLQGRKVKVPAKGIYIVNGKKVLIR